jgi:O-antigen ligase
MNMKLDYVRLGSFGLVFALFALPISSTLRSIAVAFSVVMLLLDPACRAGIRDVLKQTWVRATVALFLCVLFACFWSPASLHEQWAVLEKYSKLLYLPLFVVGFREPKIRHAALHAFLLAMLITAVLLISKALGLIHYGGDDPGKMFHNHIMTGYMFALAVYISLVYAQKAHGILRASYGVLALLLSYTVIFVGTGRMAYLAYVVVMLVWFFQLVSWRKALMLGASFLVLFAVGYAVNPTMQFLVHQAEDDWVSYQHNEKNTSLGLRIQFHTYAFELFKRHPWVGNGTGSFSHEVKRETPIQGWRTVNIWEPHSQYWLIAAEFGVLGLGLLGLFFGSLLWASLKLGEMRGMSVAVLLVFLMGSLTDSLLLYSGTGYLFLLFTALCFASGSKSSSTLCSPVDGVDDQVHRLLSTKAGKIQA